VQEADLQAVSFAQHSSREYGIVISGTLTVQVGFEKSELGPGDSIAFDSMIPHRFWNESSNEVRCVWFIRETPESERDGDGRPRDVHAFGSHVRGS
jgi:quercetin dioxygenase-like cupin family protein